MALGVQNNSSTPAADVNTIVLGELEKDVAGNSDVTLSEAEANNAFLIFSGALTGNISVIVPAEDKEYLVHNDTSGAYTLTVKKSGGTGVAVTQGDLVRLRYSTYASDVIAVSAEL